MPIRVLQRTDIPMMAGAPSDVPLAIPRVEQTQTNWCWAACAEMVLHYFGKSALAQCDFATFLVNDPSCCTAPSSPMCDTRCEYDEVGLVYGHWGIQATLVRSAVTFDTLVQELKSQQPVEVGIIWAGGGGHLVLVVQATDSNGQALVVVRDPRPDYSFNVLQYGELLTAHGYGVWDATWTGIRVGG